jgi:hypothetical protein
VKAMLLMAEEDAGVSAVKNHFASMSDHQHRLSTVLNMAEANIIQEKIVNEQVEGGLISKQSNPKLRTFVAQRNPLSNRFLNRAHLSRHLRRQTNNQFRLALWTVLGITLEAGKYSCKHCGLDVQYISHAEQCKTSRYTTNNAGLKKSHTRAYALHTELQTVLMDEFSKIPDVNVTRFNPILRGIYGLADGSEENMETQNEATKRARTAPIAQDNECHVR